MELVTRQSERSGHQQRLLQAFTEDVFIFSLLVHMVHYSVLDDVLYKFAYSLAVKYCTFFMYCSQYFFCFRIVVCIRMT